MPKYKADSAIVNRGFWPQSQVIGEALLQLAEACALNYRVVVITQSENGDLAGSLKKAKRGKGILVQDCRSLSDSSSSVLKRSFDACFFMVWTFWRLVKDRPKKVYVSTNPPIIVPFAVMLYCKVFKASYVYHLQDIHPEAADIVVRLNPWLKRFLKWLDCFVLRHAEKIITLSGDMRQCILERSNTKAPIEIIENPAFLEEASVSVCRDSDIVFCGNAGRLQLIPLLLSSIRNYLRQGGSLHFSFAGAGVHAQDIEKLSKEYESVSYHGVMSAEDAATLIKRHRWALMPIEDEVTRYAFPSKSSSYVLAGCQVFAICGKETSVAKWVEEYGVGFVAEPELDSIVDSFWEMERKGREGVDEKDLADLKERLQFSYFTKKVLDVMGFELYENVGRVFGCVEKSGECKW